VTIPLYDYRCECGVVTEARQAVTVKVIACPACGKKAERDWPRVGLHGLPTRGSSVYSADLSATEED